MNAGAVSRREAWSAIPVVVFTVAGVGVSVLIGAPEPAYSAAGVFLIFLGNRLDLRVRCVLITKAGFRARETKRLTITDDHVLITDGIFALCRHPLYLGKVLAFSLGIGLVFPSLFGGVLLGLAALSYLVRIRVEEAILLEHFGEAYQDYRRRTKMLVPYVF